MRLKLDENMDARLTVLLRQAGHDVTTIRDQGLRGMADPALYEHCISESRILVTLDFLTYSGFLLTEPLVWWFSVVRTISSPLCGFSFTHWSMLANDTPSARLWIIEPARVRIHEATLDAEE